MRHAHRPLSRLAALIATALALVWLAAPPPPSSRAAEGGLVVIAQTGYEVLPEEGRVHITIDAVATSFEPDEPDAQVFYSGVTFTAQPGASNVTASAGGSRLAARVVDETEAYTSIEVTFGHGVFFEESYAYSVSFDLVDEGGAGNRDLRITRSVVAFPVWAFGTEDEAGGSVRVELPAGYVPSAQGDEMSRALTADGGTVLSAEPRDPFAFFAYVSADRPGAFVGTRLSVAVGERTAMLLIRAWEDDADWGKRMADLMTDGLPALQSLIGVEYPVVGQLSVEEAATSRLGEYAGIYNDNTNSIRVRYDADAFVALHEAAHIWFNGALFGDRWINEAWAEYYGVSAGERIGAVGATYELTDDLLDARIALNDWGGVGVESLDVEDFAYAATYQLAGLIAERTDVEGLQAVWQAADARQAPYQPTDADRPVIGVAATQPDWQRLLDLLEERTDASYADLWVTWVVNDDQLPMLDQRADARQRYAEVIEAAGDWELPEAIRSKMGYWAFDMAVEELNGAAEVLAQRDRIARASVALDLEPPMALQSAFEGDGVEVAGHEAAQELEALDAIAVTAARLEDEPSPLEMIGLLGSDPSAGEAAARDAFEAGDAESAEAAARAAADARDAADSVGRERVVLGGAALLGINGLALVAASVRRGRRTVAAGRAEPQA